MRRLLLLSVVLTLGACTSGMTRIDREVSALILDRQHGTLGDTSAMDPYVVPEQTPFTGAGSDAYDEQPATYNPHVVDLPRGQPEEKDDPFGGRTAYDLTIEDDPSAARLDLEKILSYAMTRSRDYRSRKEELFLSTISLLSERHLWGPRFFDTITAAASGAPEPGDHDQVLELINELGVTQRLPYGGTVSASAVVSYVDLLESANGIGAGNAAQSAQLVLAGRLPLLRDAGIVAREPLIQAERNLIYAVRSFERFRREFLVQIATRYYDLIQSRDAIDNLQRQVANLEWLARRTKALAEAGRVALFEIERSEQQLLFARNNLSNALESYASSLDSFKILLNMEVAEKLVIVPSEIVVAAPVLDPEKAVAAALRQRLDLQTDRDQIGDAQRAVKVAQNQTLPDLDAFANVTLNTDPGDDTPGFELDPTHSRYSAGINAGLPLDRRIEGLALRRSLIQLERTRRDYTLSRDNVTAQVRRDVRQIERARFTLRLQERNIELAEKRLKGVLLRLRTLGPRDFIEAQDDLLEARNRRDQAVRDLRVNVLSFLLDSGQMRVSTRGQWLPPGQPVPVDTVAPADQADAQRLLGEPPTTQPRKIESLEELEVPESPIITPERKPGDVDLPPPQNDDGNMNNPPPAAP
ncbi:MAG: TolC family protein [Phycisphaeraceae bacterium]